MTQGKPRIRILLAKPGLDGHDVGAKVVVRALMDAGFDVVYTGLKKTPEEIVRRAVEENVDVLGLSILSGSHLPLCREIRDLLAGSGLDNVLWVVGGNIPHQDHPDLEALGVAAVFGVGSSPQDIVDFVRERTS
ncbi:MAG: cobalamin B12-binding domain-containing protein [Planctomycetota bacterium]|jgi:methylmalonyl-CoA mutase C-terminal domain/subunit